LNNAVFLAVGFVSALLQGGQTCAGTKASPTPKNLRFASRQHFYQCSNFPKSTGKQGLMQT